MNDIVLAVDLGGTNMRMAAITGDGDILHHTKSGTPKQASPVQLTALIGAMADECRDALPADGRLVGISFAAPAPAAKNTNGVLTRLPNIPTLNGMDLKAALSGLFDLPITIENDATAAGIGEDWLGASKDVESSICVTLGTGIGGGIILAGEPLRGLDGTGGEIGHICVEPGGVPCGCGSRGCVERYASATAIVRMAKEAGMEVSTAFEVYETSKRRDGRAQAVFQKMGRYLGIMLAGLINTLNPEMIVIAGGVAAGWDAFVDHVQNEINARAYPEPVNRATLVRATLGDDAGILGAARSSFLSSRK